MDIISKFGSFKNKRNNNYQNFGEKLSYTNSAFKSSRKSSKGSIIDEISSDEDVVIFSQTDLIEENLIKNMPKVRPLNRQHTLPDDLFNKITNNVSLHVDSDVEPMVRYIRPKTAGPAYYKNKIRRDSNVEPIQPYSDSGFTSPARSLSGGKSGIKLNPSTNSKNFQKSKFQSIGTFAVSFEKFHTPKNFSIFNDIFVVTCSGRQGQVNIFKILQYQCLQKNKDNYIIDQDYNLTKPKHNDNVAKIKSFSIKSELNLRSQASFQIEIDNKIFTPKGVKFDLIGRCYITIGSKIAQFNHLSDVGFDDQKISPDRLICCDCLMLNNLAFSRFNHIITSDTASDKISLIDYESGTKIFDYNNLSNNNILKPSTIVRVKDDILVLSNETTVIRLYQRKEPDFVSYSSIGATNQVNPNINTYNQKIIYSHNKNSNFQATSLVTDKFSNILVARYKRDHVRINNRTVTETISKLSLMTINGQILVDDILNEPEKLLSGISAICWEKFPKISDMCLNDNVLYLLGDDKMVHCYKLN